MKFKILSLKLYLFLLLSILIIFKVSGTAVAMPLPDPDKLHYSALHFNLPEARRIVLENGIVLYFLEDHELPLVTINAIVRTGTMYDPEGKEGVAELTGYMMRTGGTQKLSSTEVDDRFDFLAASAAIMTSLDHTRIIFSSLNKDLDKGLNLLSQVLITPAFEQKKFELAKSLKAEEIRRLKDDPQRLAFREFNRLIYRDNPRGKFISTKSLKNIERKDLINFHDKFYQPQNIMFAVTGDISLEEAISKIKLYFGNWQSHGKPAVIPALPQKSPSGFFCIDKDITQSIVITGQFAPGKNNPDYYAFTLLDFIIGSGGFPSRIFSAVRNNEGLAYSAGSSYRDRPDQGIFAAYAFTKTESTIKTFSLIESILNQSKEDSITASEIEWAKKSINNSFVFSFTTPEQISWQQMKLEYDQMPSDFLSTYRDKISRITIEDLNKVSTRYLHNKDKITLILGNFKKFEENLAGSRRPVLIIPEE